MIFKHRLVPSFNTAFALSVWLASPACDSSPSDEANVSPRTETGREDGGAGAGEDSGTEGARTEGGGDGSWTDGNGGLQLGDAAPRDPASHDGQVSGEWARDGSEASDDGAGGRGVDLDAAREMGANAAPATDAGSSRRSAGCGLPATGTSSYTRQTVTIANTTREYFLWVPRTYEPSQAYPIVFRWHGATGNGLSGGLEIEASSGENAIIVSPSGIDGLWDVSPTGVDVALFDTLLALLEAAYCIDKGRVFSYGFSMGGGFTELLGCVRSSVVRGIAPVEATSPTTMCPGKVAARITQSPDDMAVSFDGAIASRGLFLAADGCATTTVPVSPSPCVRYQGCAEGYPVDWCQTSGPHNPQGAFTGPAAWSFFDSLR
jgi:poly(3-hydroxybutyrate) depolymerase